MIVLVHELHIVSVMLYANRSPSSILGIKNSVTVVINCAGSISWATALHLQFIMLLFIISICFLLDRLRDMIAPR